MSTPDNSTPDNKQATPARSKLSPLLVLILLSVSVNGLLLGLLLASRPHSPSGLPQHTRQISIRTDTADPRRLLRGLPPARRQQILHKAFQTLDLPKSEQPRVLFARLHKAKRKVHRLLKADKIDIDQLKQVQSEIRALNGKLAKTGDALMLAVFEQLTPEERAQALKSLRKGRPGANRQRRIRPPQDGPQ